MMKKLKLLAWLLSISIGAAATETTVWQGTKTFASWSDVLNIDGSKLKGAKADDVLHLSITASDGAQLQISWGAGWTNFDGLGALGISGDYDMPLTAENASRLTQGIHIKGVNFTLTAVVLKTNDGEYTTESEELFAWKDMLMSGATQGQKCTMVIKPYGGAGWHWPETVDLSGYGSIVIELLQPASENLTAQLLYGEKSVKRQVIAKGAAQCKLTLTAAHRKAYSLNFISEKDQVVALGRVNLTDKQGNIVPTGISSLVTDESQVVATEYYNLAGVRHSGMQPGVNIVKSVMKGGRTVVRKVIK